MNARDVTYDALEQVNIIPFMRRHFDIAELIRRFFALPIWQLFLVFIGGFAILSLPYAFGASETAISALLNIIMLSMIVAGFILKSYLSKRHLHHWQAFANDNKWLFTRQTAESPPTPLALASKQTSKMQQNVRFQITGSIGQMPFTLYQTTSIAYRHTDNYEPWLIVSVPIMKNAPHLFLTSIKDMTTKAITRNLARIKLEGDFDNYFSTYMENDRQIEALSLLTPDVMQRIIDSRSYGFIEIQPGYLFTVVELKNTVLNNRPRRIVEELFENTEQLWDQITERERRYS